MRRRVATAIVWIGLGTAAGACAPRTHRTTLERIAGVERVRPFASSTAYEAFLRAEVAAARGDLPRAARQLELAEIADPADGYLPARRAEILLQAGTVPEALAVAREATARLPDSAAAWVVLGEVLLAQGDRAGATAAFTRALAAAPDDPEVRGAVARAQGAPADEVARAIEHAPDALPGDRTVAQRLALDPLRDDRPTLRAARRARAQQAWERRAYREVDRILSPIVEADATDVIDRVRVIEARALDGRPGDAARLVPGVPVRTSGRGVSAADRARLWLLAARPELAAEEAEAAFRADAGDILARVVLGRALVQTGATGRGVALLAAVPLDSPRFVEARVAAAEGLARTGRPELGEATLVRAVAWLAGPDAVGRDRLRLAQATSLMRRGVLSEARAALQGVESRLGRQQRGALLAHLDAPAAVLADLRVRTGVRGDDAVADAWVALVCRQNPAACAADEGERALASARSAASGAPETLRALAAYSTDRRAAFDLLREAAARDPLSPWNGALSRQVGAIGGHPRGQ